MRDKLNNNPMYQMGILAICGVIFAFILFTSVLKKSDPDAQGATTADPASQTAADPSASGATAPAAPVATADPSTGTATPPVDTGTTVPPTTAPTGTGSADGLLPSKGLPKDVLVAYAKGDAIGLLVVNPDANGTHKAVFNVQRGAPAGTKVFLVKVDDIGDYSRITQGVSVSRTPALVVIRPRKLTESAPMATVTYDLQSPQSAQQAIADALYEGGNVPAYPTDPDKKNKNKDKNKDKGK